MDEGQRRAIGHLKDAEQRLDGDPARAAAQAEIAQGYALVEIADLLRAQIGAPLHFVHGQPAVDMDEVRAAREARERAQLAEADRRAAADRGEASVYPDETAWPIPQQNGRVGVLGQIPAEGEDG